MAKIQLTPAELLAQSQEMAALRDEYETFFKGTSSLLNTINANWSTKLAHNFAGKITSAQKSFDQITSMLEQGANLANTSANTFQSMDELLAKGAYQTAQSTMGIKMAAVTEDVKVASSTSSRPNLLEYLWQDAVNSWKHAGEGIDYFKNLINSNLSKEEQEASEKMLEYLMGEDNYKVTKIVLDIISGDADWDTLSGALKLMEVPKAYAQVIVGSMEQTVKTVFDKEWQARYTRFNDIMMEPGFDHIAGRIIAATGQVTDTIFIGVAEMFGDMALDTVENVPILGGVLEQIVGVDLSDGFENIMGDMRNGFADFMGDAAETVSAAEDAFYETVGKVARGVEDVVSGAVDAAKDMADNAIDGAKSFVSDALDSIGNLWKRR